MKENAMCNGRSLPHWKRLEERISFLTILAELHSKHYYNIVTYIHFENIYNFI